MVGQILLSHEFGQWLYKISSRNDVKTIVEIGTWNGAGSTACIWEAVKNTDKQFWSLEIDKEMYSKAISQYPSNQNIHLLLGKITNEVVNLNDYGSEYFTDYSRETKAGWLAQDLSNMANVPNVLDQLPDTIDFLLLDGGEFSNWAEYQLLKDRSRIIACDDTRCPVMKNTKVREELIKERVVLVDKLYERNGWMICERK